MGSMRGKQELTAETQRHGDQRGEDGEKRGADTHVCRVPTHRDAWRLVPTLRLGVHICTALLSLPLSAAVVDRVAVVVGKTVITESEVLQEVRLTEFLNGQPLELGPQQRRDAAERLVDQQLIRNEMEIGSYPQPSASESQAVLQKFQKEHYASPTEFQAALQKYGVTEDQLQQHLIWELEAIHFTDLRFSPGTPTSGKTAAAPTSPTGGKPPSSKAVNRPATPTGADRSDPNSKATPSTAADPESATVDQQMDAWLKEARGQVRIQFKKEAFQ
jgi:hypothetical protein